MGFENLLFFFFLLIFVAPVKVVAMENMFSKLRNLDAYPKINEDFYSRTLSGGIITLVSSLAILFLFFSEFSNSSLDPFFAYFCGFLYILILEILKKKNYEPNK